MCFVVVVVLISSITNIYKGFITSDTTAQITDICEKEGSDGNGNRCLVKIHYTVDGQPYFVDKWVNHSHSYKIGDSIIISYNKKHPENIYGSYNNVIDIIAGLSILIMSITLIIKNRKMFKKDNYNKIVL